MVWTSEHYALCSKTGESMIATQNSLGSFDVMLKWCCSG